MLCAQRVAPATLTLAIVLTVGCPHPAPPVAVNAQAHATAPRPAEPPPTGAEAHGTAPVADLLLTLPEDPSQVVLAYDADTALAHGAPVLVFSGSPVVTRVDVDPARLPPALAARMGQRVRLYGPGGAVCEGTLGAPALVHRVEVHFGVRARWTGDDQQPPSPMSPDAIARQAWDDADGPTLLTATVHPDQGSCAQARWARSASAPELPMYTVTPADPAATAQALVTFRATPAWQQLQADYRGDPHARPGGTWDAHDTDSLVVRSWHRVGTDRTFVTVEASTSVGGCVDFSGRLWGYYEIVQGHAVPLAAPAEPALFHAEAAVDLDGDGVPELVGDPGLVRLLGALRGLAESLVYPNHDCAC